MRKSPRQPMLRWGFTFEARGLIANHGKLTFQEVFRRVVCAPSVRFAPVSAINRLRGHGQTFLAPAKSLDISQCKVLHGVMGWFTQRSDQVLTDSGVDGSGLPRIQAVSVAKATHLEEWFRE